MSDAARAELRQRLGNLDLLDALDDAAAVALLGLLHDARRRQRDALAEAQRHALRFVPGVLRKPLLKLFE